MRFVLMLKKMLVVVFFCFLLFTEGFSHKYRKTHLMINSLCPFIFCARLEAIPKAHRSYLQSILTLKDKLLDLVLLGQLNPTQYFTHCVHYDGNKQKTCCYIVMDNDRCCIKF